MEEEGAEGDRASTYESEPDGPSKTSKTGPPISETTSPLATPDTARPDGAAENQRRAASGSETEGAEGAVALTPTKEAQDAAEAEKVARDKLLAKFAARSPATRLESGSESEPDARSKTSETGKPVFGLMSPSTEKAVKTKKKKKKQPPPSAVGGSDSVPLSPAPSPPSPDPPR